MKNNKVNIKIIKKVIGFFLNFYEYAHKTEIELQDKHLLKFIK